MLRHIRPHHGNPRRGPRKPRRVCQSEDPLATPECAPAARVPVFADSGGASRIRPPQSRTSVLCARRETLHFRHRGHSPLTCILSYPTYTPRPKTQACRHLTQPNIQTCSRSQIKSWPIPQPKTAKSTPAHEEGFAARWWPAPRAARWANERSDPIPHPRRGSAGN